MNRALTFSSSLALAVCSLVLLLDLFCPPSAHAQTIQPLFTFTCSVTIEFHQQVVTCPKGQQPNSLLQSADGNFYGRALFKGNGNQAFDTVFKITPAGQMTILHTFVADLNGNYPNAHQLARRQ